MPPSPGPCTISPPIRKWSRRWVECGAPARSAEYLLRRGQRHDLRRRAADLEGRRYRGVRLLQDQDDREAHGGLPPYGETGDEPGARDPPVQGAGRLRPVIAVRQRRRHRPRRLRGEQGARRPLPRPGRRGAEDPYGSRCPHHRAAPGRLRPVTLAYRIRAGDGRSTEELVAAGNYGYAHSCVTSDNFPVRPTSPTVREIVLLAFDREVSSEDAIAEATRHDLARPEYEDALYFGAAYPDVQRERPVVFLHEPWLGFFGRRDVVCLWTNAGRRELGLVGFDDPRARDDRLAFVAGSRVVESHE